MILFTKLEWRGDRVEYSSWYALHTFLCTLQYVLACIPSIQKEQPKGLSFHLYEYFFVDGIFLEGLANVDEKRREASKRPEKSLAQFL